MPISNSKKTKKTNLWLIVFIGILSAMFLAPSFIQAPMSVQESKRQDVNLSKMGEFLPEYLKGRVEFFSFYCPHCYAFEYEYGIVGKAKELGELKQYHVDFMGRSSKLLTKYWSMAIFQEKQDLVKAGMFALAMNELQTNEPITEKMLNDLFASKGLEIKEDSEGKVASLVKFQQSQPVFSVPSFYLDSVLINYDSFKAKTNEEFIEKLLEALSR